MNQSSWRSFPRLGAFFFTHGIENRATGIEFFKKHNLVCAQIGDPLMKELVASPARIPEVVRDFHDAGIEIIGLAGYRNLVAADPAARKENIAYLQKCLELAPEFGTAIVATETGTRHPSSDWDPSLDNTSPQAWDLLVDAIGSLLQTAEKSGSVLALEGYVNNILSRLDHIDALLRTFPSPRLALMLDPYNYITRDLVPVADLFCEEFLRRYADRFVIAHLKDVAPLGAGGGGDDGRADLAGTPEFCTGIFPQQAYMRFLRDRSPDLPIIFEHLPDEHLADAIVKFRCLSGLAF